jgi:hypothetical protein
MAMVNAMAMATAKATALATSETLVCLIVTIQL